MIKKILRILMVTIMAAMTLMLCACSGCRRDEDSGYFTVEFYNDRKSAHITGLTELGKQQRFLVIPEEIGGAIVMAIGKSPLLEIWPSIGSADICSETLEKVYFTSSVYIVAGSFRDCPNFTKVMVINGDYINGIDYPIKKCYSKEAYIGKGFSKYEHYIMSNVAYFYNYETEENDGYYWIDDWDYGSKIEFIPPEPEREGYTFGGWYKEAECINKWNFETDVLPEERTETNEDGEEEVVYQETKLYAKWL